MFDQIQHFTDIAQNFKPAQWGAQIQEQFQHFQGWRDLKQSSHSTTLLHSLPRSS